MSGSNTLSKFGVPLGGGAGRGGLLMPKLQNRYRVRVINFGPIAGGLELTQQVQSTAKPSITQEGVQIDSYNSRAWIAGKHNWNPIELVVKDDVTNSVTTLIGYQMQKQLNHFEQTAFESGINYKFQMYIETLDGGNDVVLDAWFLEGCFLSDIKFSELNYAASELQLITMTVRYDNAQLTGGLMTDTPALTAGVTVD
jgi:hypothetical protein